MTRNGVLKAAATFKDQVFDRLAKRHLRSTAIMVLAAPALVTGLVITVHSGNTLSGLAAQYCGATHTNDWTGIYQTNIKTIGGNPNLIYPGQKLTIKCYDPPALLKLGSTGSASAGSSGGKIWGVTYGDPNYCGDGDGDGWDVKCQSTPSSQGPSAVSYSAPSATVVNPGNYGGFQACVIARESGGNSQVMNSTGHYGLYQFSYSTWVAYGGNGADFGHASVAEQNQVFANAMATPNGASNWAPYDGC